MGHPVHKLIFVVSDHGSFRGFDGLETYQYLANDTPMTIPKPEERGMRMAPKKSSTPKLGQQVNNTIQDKLFRSDLSTQNTNFRFKLHLLHKIWMILPCMTSIMITFAMNVERNLCFKDISSKAFFFIFV